MAIQDEENILQFEPCMSVTLNNLKIKNFLSPIVHNLHLKWGPRSKTGVNCGTETTLAVSL
jgi:hypothetical protein